MLTDMTKGNGARLHPIRVVVRRTGLPAATLRAWERRYGVITPKRSEGGQRLYTDDDIDRLRAVVRALQGGRRISQVAPLETSEIERLIQGDLEAGVPESPAASDDHAADVAHALRLVESMDTEELERFLMRAAVSHTPTEVVSGILVPLLREVGAAWSTGRFGPSSEHLASVTVRRYLEWLSDAVQVSGSAPLAVTGTPAGQRHEFGALLAGVLAADQGWRLRFLGPDLPAEEIRRAAERLGASLVILSAIHPDLPVETAESIALLRSDLPDHVDLVIGGRAAEPHRGLWSQAGVLYFDGLDAYRSALEEIYRRRYGTLASGPTGATVR